MHPSLLDVKALVAGWREALLAQAVLAGRTRGYTRHPQLKRFQALRDPLAGIGAYLKIMQNEATQRGYQFDAKRILKPRPARGQLRVSRGQLKFEFEHLSRKSRKRSPAWARRLARLKPKAHPLFKIVPGPVASWEKDPRAHAKS